MPETSADLSVENNQVKIKKQTQFGQIMGRLSKNPVAMGGLIVLIIFILLAVFAPWISPYNYQEMNIPNAFQGPSRAHWFGTDDLGRDVLSRMLFGGRYSLGLGFLAQIIAVGGGMIFGSIAGYFGGTTENLIMRACDVFQSIPSLLLSIIVSTALGSGIVNTALALSLGGIASNCRMTRAEFLTIRENEFIEAAQASNCSRFRIIVRHMLPNSLSPLIIGFTMGLGSTILHAASLSYLGLGVQPPTPEWGAMLSNARAYYRTYPYLLLFPGLCIIVVVLAINLFGDGLRDAMDPKLKK